MASHLFGQHAHLDGAEPQASVRLGDGDGGPAELPGELAPDGAIEALCTGDGLPHAPWRGHVGQDPARAVAERGLFVVEGEPHGVTIHIFNRG